MPDEFIMPVTKPDAVAQMEIHALRQLSDLIMLQGKSIDAVAKSQEATNLKMDDVRERVIKIEGQNVKGDVTKLDAKVEAACLRIDALERIKDRQDGAIGAGNWLAKYAPWLVALVMAALAGIGIKTGAGS